MSLDKAKTDQPNIVQKFYETKGWSADQNEVHLDAALFEDLRPVAEQYIRNCRLRVLSFLPPNGGDKLVDAGCGPIQYPEYLEFSKSFKKRICVDFSKEALQQAEKKIGDKGEYICSTLEQIPLPDNTADAVVCMHTIYHIEKSKQESAVKELLRIAKPGAPVLIVYSNPTDLLRRLKEFAYQLGLKKRPPNNGNDELYFYAHPNSWWSETFQNSAQVELHSWRMLGAEESKRFIPNNFLGSLLFHASEAFEKTFNGAATTFGTYPLVVLKKR